MNTKYDLEKLIIEVFVILANCLKSKLQLAREKIFSFANTSTNAKRVLGRKKAHVSGYSKILRKPVSQLKPEFVTL